MAERKHGWGPRDQNVLIGKEITRIDALPKITGAAKYSADINTKGTLFAKVVTCKHAHAILKKIDVEAAKKIPGVKAVHLFKELDDEIRWDGDLIAAVAAERVEQAADGVKAIEATIEYEVLEHFVDEADLEAGKKADRARERGNAKEAAVETQNEGEIDTAIDAAIKGAKVVHKGFYGIQTISHMCLEPHGSHCEWKGEELDVHLSTQNVSGTAGQFAEPLGIDQANVTITGNYEGGGFGSKFQADEWGLAAAKMAQETGRPVRLMLDRATELKVAGTRPSGFVEVTVAADAEGKVIAWDSHHWGSDGMAGGGVDVGQLPYPFKFPNTRKSQTGLECNTGPNRAWRAPPHPQLCAMTQTALDDVAGKLGMNSYDFFLKNLEFTLNDKAGTYAEELEIAAKAIGWKEKWHPRGQGGNGPVKRGLGMALHRWGGGAGPCTCEVKVHPDGSVETFLGSQDIGTGTRTIISIVLAETFGLPLSGVKVNLGSSKYPPSAASGGSITVGGVSGAHRRAAQDALWTIFDKVAEKYKVEADALRAKDGKILAGNKEVCTWKQACGLLGQMPLVVKGEGPKKDGLTSDQVGGVQMVDLSVDTETGNIRIHKFVCVQDCGLILDELTAKSQVLGALIMGIAYSLSEERIMDNKTGRYINADLKNYKLPRIGDVGERGVVGLGEPPVIAPGAAISNAVANATGIRVPVIPLTPKRVLDALKKGGNA
jgi:xanthine dehydrogenase YagR molybdenum-binding subunit